MARRVSSALLGLFVLAVLAAPGVRAATDSNVQDGENSSRTSQNGRGRAGEAITGQVVGVSSGGPASVDATNNTRDSTAQTGDATGQNHARSFTGLRASAADKKTPASNAQSGDNRSSISQTASAVTGDGIGGQIIGVAARGPTRIVASNTTTNSNVFTGNADASNSAGAFTGLDITDTGTNVQEGDNRGRIRQSAHASTGDGVGGQVIGASVTGGSLVVDARNRTEDTTVLTGSADATNGATAFVGLRISDTGTNTQAGDNRGSISQSSRASSGDAVGGQVAGLSATGGVSAVLANSTSDVIAESGDTDADDSEHSFVGLSIAGTVLP